MRRGSDTGASTTGSVMDSKKNESCRSRVRPRSSDVACSEASTSLASSSYRKGFSCQLTGRYFRSSKRKICWSFGLSSAGKTAEEHRVELVWSLKSGKTRVYWNGRNISNFFREGTRSGVVKFGWEARTGETLKIVAHAEPVASMEHQYNLFIDGVSFFDLEEKQHPPMSSERAASLAPLQQEYEFVEQRSPDSECSVRLEPVQSLDEVSELGYSDADPTEPAKTDRGSKSLSGARSFEYRMSLIGINTGASTIEVVDELIESDCYTPLVNQMRTQITSYLPQTEETVSKAITNALFVDSDSSRDSDSSFSESTLEIDPGQIEAAALWEAFQWVSRNTGYPSRLDSEERALAYMQEQIESAFVNVRKEVLTSSHACLILLNVGAVLGFKFAKPVPNTTVVLDGLSRKTAVDTMCEDLSSFGDIVAAGVVQGHGFGFVRFVHEEACKMVQLEADNFTIDKVKPRLIFLSDSFQEGLSQNRSISSRGRSSSARMILDASAVTSPDHSDSLAGETETSTVSSSVMDTDLSMCNTSPDTVTRMVEPSSDSIYKPERPVYTSFLG